MKAAVDLLAPVVDAPEVSLPTYGFSRDGGRPHIEVDGPVMSYVTVEHGAETGRRSSADLDDILYWVFQSATFEMAAAYGLAHRIEDGDPGRLRREKQLELLGRLNPNWVTRRRHDLERLDR